MEISHNQFVLLLCGILHFLLSLGGVDTVFNFFPNICTF